MTEKKETEASGKAKKQKIKKATTGAWWKGVSNLLDNKDSQDDAESGPVKEQPVKASEATRKPQRKKRSAPSGAKTLPKKKAESKKTKQPEKTEESETQKEAKQQKET
ncbi:MAG TPA: hypothetical protein ENI88_07685, partial [Desulfobulbus sp.]|nr:hypothetical protein [Desulfobulbus sp.]